MKNKTFLPLLFFLVCLSPQFIFAQETIDSTQVQNFIWPDRSPRTLEQGRKVWPLFGVKRMGAKKNMEWQIQPLFFFISPNLGLKKHWKKNQKGLRFSTLHKINYPSIYLKMISREGAGGVLPKDSSIPSIISIKNELLLGYQSQKNFLTLRAGIVAAFNFGAEKDFPSIDIPFFYNRTLAFNASPNLYSGLNFNRDLRPKLNLEADFTFFLVDLASNDFVVESRLVFFWKKSDRFGLKWGVASAHGRYPFGSIVQFVPVFDVLFGFGNNKKERR